MPVYVDTLEKNVIRSRTYGIHTSINKNFSFPSIERDTFEYTDTRNKYQLESRENNMDQVRNYFKKISTNFNRIDLNELIVSGMPTVKNTRIPINIILSCLKDEMTFDEIAMDYNISKEDIVEGLEYSIELLTRPYMDE